MKVDRIISQAIWEHHANTKGFPNMDYLNDLEKIRKALEIIKNKRVDCWLLIKHLKLGYSYIVRPKGLKVSEIELTEEEYELLKEILK